MNAHRHKEKMRNSKQNVSQAIDQLYIGSTKIDCTVKSKVLSKSQAALC